MAAIEKSESIHLMENYEKILRKNYPERAINFYVECVLNEMYIANTRSQYRQTIWYLKKISKFPEGRQEAVRIANEWKEQYKRRSAMLDELRKAGF